MRVCLKYARCELDIRSRKCKILKYEEFQFQLPYHMLSRVCIWTTKYICDRVVEKKKYILEKITQDCVEQVDCGWAESGI